MQNGPGRRSSGGEGSGALASTSPARKKLKDTTVTRDGVFVTTQSDQTYIFPRADPSSNQLEVILRARLDLGHYRNILKSQPWEQMFVDRHTSLRLSDTAGWILPQRAALQRIVDVMFTHRQAFWERQQWVLLETGSSEYTARHTRASGFAKAWTTLMASMQRLQMPVNVWYEPGLWFRPN